MSASHAPTTPPRLTIGAPTPENDQLGSDFEYVARMRASQRKPATTSSHHDSRTSRANRGDSGAAPWAIAPPRTLAIFLFENMGLPQRLHVPNYTPGKRGTHGKGNGSGPGLEDQRSSPHQRSLQRSMEASLLPEWNR